VSCTAGGSATLTGGANGGSSVGLSAGTIAAGGSCTITQAVTTFGPDRGFTQNICAASYAPVLTTLAAAIFGG